MLCRGECMLCRGATFCEEDLTKYEFEMIGGNHSRQVRSVHQTVYYI